LARNVIYIASTEELAGKSTIAIALALLARSLGHKVGYFKPIGLESSLSERREALDEDVKTVSTILNLKGEASLVSPLTLKKNDFLEDLGKHDLSEYASKIAVAYRRASESKDTMLIEGGSNLSVGSVLGCSVPKLAADFGARILLIARFKNDFVVDEILQAQEYCSRWGVPLLGVILNRFPQNTLERANHVIRPLLEKNGVRVLGVIAEDSALSALTVKDLHQVIGGRVLGGKDGMDKTFQTVLVGAMTPESAVKYFREAKDELVITGGDRTDIIFAALEAGIAALILTGNLYPNVKILPRADDLTVPIILVPYDTYTTLQLIQRIVGRIKASDRKRINRAKALVKEHVDWKTILTGSSA